MTEQERIEMRAEAGRRESLALLTGCDPSEIAPPLTERELRQAVEEADRQRR